MSGFDRVLAQLRHAYFHLSAEAVVKQKEFADGLIAPAIRALEEHVAKECPHCPDYVGKCPACHSPRPRPEPKD